MKKRNLIAILFLLITAPVVFGQGLSPKHSVGISWGASTPVGKNNFLNNACWVSPAISYEYKLSDYFSLGATLGYEYGKESQMTTDRYYDDLLDGHTTRKLTAVPVQAQVLYFPLRSKESSFQPYLGVGAGVNYAKFDITGDLISPVGKSNWAEVFTGRAGLRYILGSGGTSLDASLFWQQAGNDFKPLHVERRQSIGIRIGMVFGL